MNENKIILSIIIPEYNGYKTIMKCLNSIYEQKVSEQLFEVVCVDDGSTDGKSAAYIEKEFIAKTNHFNFKFIKSPENRGIGGARNVALLHASGEWVMYLDCDDYLLLGNLLKLIQFLSENVDVDLVPFDFNRIDMTLCNGHLSKNKMPGKEFLNTQSIPWNATCYAYRKSFLEKNDIHFVEKVYFEDVDYVMKSIFNSAFVKYAPIPVYFYVLYPVQTSKIATNYKKAEDAFGLSMRLRKVASEIKPKDEESYNTVIRHHYYMYLHNLYFIWVFSFSQILGLLRKYPAEKSKNMPFLVAFSLNFPGLFAFTLTLFKPLLFLLRKIKG